MSCVFGIAVVAIASDHQVHVRPGASSIWLQFESEHGQNSFLADIKDRC